MIFNNSLRSSVSLVGKLLELEDQKYRTEARHNEPVGLDSTDAASGPHWPDRNERLWRRREGIRRQENRDCRCC